VTAEITFTLILAGLQVLTLRVAQYALPALYFSTASLFDRRSEVTAGAIAFRLAIPFTAGMLVPLVLTENEIVVASASGAIAWFLVLWPIAWAPSLMLPSARGWPITGLLLLFWVAFALLPVGGVEVTHLIQGTGDRSGAFLAAVVAGVPVTILVELVARASKTRVTFADDVSEEPDDEAPDDDYTPSRLERLENVNYLIPNGVVSVATLLVLVLILIRGRRPGRA
jgi:hypothetical protein